MSDPRDLTEWAGERAGATGRVSTMAAGLIGSEILKIAADIRELQREGVEICNLTVGDFDPSQFPIPDVLRDAIRDALVTGQTNYPPANGMPELRSAVQRFYRRELGLNYPVDSVLIAGGARPVIYGIYRALLDPGDVVVYPVPSWNNNHYCHMLGAKPLELICGPENRFLPTAADLKAALPEARLICLNSPLNPTGTAIEPEVLRGICEAIIAENHHREAEGKRPVYLLYDHIYWMLTFGDVTHVTPPELIPEMARYTIFVDGISKAFAATGVRVGWAVGPIDVIKRMSAILGHVGAWAPRAEQVATVRLLDDADAIARYHAGFLAGIDNRLRRLHAGFQAMKADGLSVDSITPMGAIYLTARIDVVGKTTPRHERLANNEDIRKYLLDAARFAMVPFQAFGMGAAGQGWFRLSAGAVSEQDIVEALPRVADALRALT